MAIDQKRKANNIGLGVILIILGLIIYSTGSVLSALFIFIGIIELSFHPDWKAYDIGLGTILLASGALFFLTGSWLWPFFIVFGVAELWFTPKIDNYYDLGSNH
jgi:hypothetical protein